MTLKKNKKQYKKDYRAFIDFFCDIENKTKIKIKHKKAQIEQ